MTTLAGAAVVIVAALLIVLGHPTGDALYILGFIALGGFAIAWNEGDR